jgi:hypothetical protein
LTAVADGLVVAGVSPLGGLGGSKLLASGAFEEHWGGGDETAGSGVATSGVASELAASVTDADGRIVLAGSTPGTHHPVLTRLLADGQPDTGFGFVDDSVSMTVADAALLTDGSIVVVGAPTFAARYSL